MLKNLPFEPFDFVRWYFADFPVYLFKLAKKIVVLVNNELGLTLNFRLLFTPLFGDYTYIGRLIGFIVRVCQVVFGLLFLLLTFIFAYLSPVIWFLLPLIIAVYLKFWVLLYFAVVFFSWLLLHKEKPKKRVAQVSGDAINEAFRLTAAQYVHELTSAGRITPEFLAQREIARVLMRLELTSPDFLTKLGEQRPNFADLEKRAFEYAKKQNTRYVDPEHVLVAAISLVPKIENLLAEFSSTLDMVEQTVVWVVGEHERLAKVLFWQEDYELPRMGGIGRGMTGQVTPKLNAISQDFTKMAQKGYVRNVVAHKKEIQDVTTLLSGNKKNVLLIGPPGCGKTSVVLGIAQNIVKGTDEQAIKFKRIVALDTGSLLAGTKSVGDISEKVQEVMREAKSSGDIIIFFDEIHNFISGANGGDGSAIFALFENHLVGSDMQFIGATNLENYRKYIEPSGAFARLFEIVEIPEASPEETLDVLKGKARDLEKESNILISYPALATIIDLSKKLIHERVFPDKAIDVLIRASASVTKTSKYLTTAEIRAVISEMTHVPVTTLSEDESTKLLNLGDELKKRVIGQDHALGQVVKALQRARAGIRNENKPIASFLFVGTTGVGKTETAKALASTYFNDEKAMIRLDMSEYQEQNSIKRLIGDPGGEKQGILTEAVRNRPYSLILLDEIEKAYSSILLTFLQVLDDGRLTDAAGVTVNFTNTIIISTSNVGTRSLQEVSARGGTVEEMEQVATREVRNHFAPEFLNRFDGVIVYKPLTVDVVRKICDLMLNRVRKMSEEKGIKVSFKPELLDELVKRGYSDEWGARELSRTISDSVESYLALKMLSKEIMRGQEIELGLEVFGSH